MAESTESTSKKWRERFLWKLSQRGNVSEAAQFAGVDRSYTYRVRREDADFDAQCEEAEAVAVDRLEQVAFRRATAQSDTLLIFLLKAHRREKYGDQLSVNHLLKVITELRQMPEPDRLELLGYEPDAITESED